MHDSAGSAANGSTSTATLAPTWDRERVAGKYLTFLLAEEQFGIQLLKVREIIGLMPITPVPGSPKEIRGVLNLRGKIVPVMDLRLRFGMGAGETNARNCIIVTEVAGQNGIVEMGILVDAVSEVLQVDGNEIEPAPEFGTRVDTSYLLGLAMSGPQTKVLIDIDRVLVPHSQ